jgi:acetyltransferase-like isoleucine patch superfamily enzyme
MSWNAETELLAEFEELVRTDRLPEKGSQFFGGVSTLVDDFLSTGRFELPRDPFRGQDRQMALESDLYYVMFWRMFDRTPAAMLQDFAIKLRRILAKRVFKSCGDDVVIHHNVLFNSGRNIELGDGVFLNRDVMLDDRAPLTIGDHAMVAAGVVIETHSHVFDDFSVPVSHSGRTSAPVHVGSNTLIGYKVAVMAGVNIGNRCVVAANSVVTKDVPDQTIVGGVPARLIKKVVPRSDDSGPGAGQPR